MRWRGPAVRQLAGDGDDRLSQLRLRSAGRLRLLPQVRDGAGSAAVARAEERKVVTTLFCDLVAFTAMSEAADPEDVDAPARRVLRPRHAR